MWVDCEGLSGGLIGGKLAFVFAVNEHLQQIAERAALARRQFLATLPRGFIHRDVVTGFRRRRLLIRRVCTVVCHNVSMFYTLFTYRAR